MNDPLKYIIVKKGNLNVPIVFPGILNHSDVAKSFKDVIGAGFCYPPDENNPTYSVHGKSFTLQIESKPEDEKELNYWLTVD